MNLIQEELLAAKAFAPDTYDDAEGLVKLTRENIAKAEMMVANDSRYMVGKEPTWNSNGKITYAEPSSHWLRRLGKELLNPTGMDDDEYSEIIKQAVAAIDRENSAHLNADGKGREELASRIASLERPTLLRYLKRPGETEYELIEILRQQTHPEPPRRPRSNLSFASKFCHYACYNIFEDRDEQDNYPIYDSVVKRALPMYVEYFGLRKRSQNALGDYATYRACIDEVIAHAKEPISRNGFDHLIWYYYKGRI